MIRNLQNISGKECDKLIGKRFSIYEKLDMVYFKVHITSEGADVLKVPVFDKVSEIDILCNDMYKDISDFVDLLMKRHGNEIADRYGDIRIGFFYLPARISKTICYENIPEYSYILSDSDIADFDYKLISDMVMAKPLIAEDVEFTTDMAESLSLSPVECLKRIIGDNYIWSGNEPDKIEGIVIRFQKFQYQVVINNCDKSVDKFSTKIYRDEILNDFSNKILIGESDFVNGLIESDMNYIDTVCHLFCEYMYLTDIFGRKHIEADDLVPPHNGYFGRMIVDDIPYDTAKILCRYDERATNVLRILLYAFCKDHDFSTFNKTQSKVLKQLNTNLLTKLTN